MRVMGRPKHEAARIEKVVDFETLLTTTRDLLYLRDSDSIPETRNSIADTKSADTEIRSSASKRVMSLLTNKFQGKIVRYINLGKDSQRRIIAANVEVIEPPPSSPEKAMEDEDEDPFFKK